MIRNKTFHEKPKHNTRTPLPAIPPHVNTLDVTVVKADDARLVDEEIASLVNTAPVEKLTLERRMGGAAFVLRVHDLAVVVDTWELWQLLHRRAP